MFKKWKRWLFRRFLPAWCREELLAENDALCRDLERARRENNTLRAYIDGMEYAIRRQGRVIIHTGEVRGDGHPVRPAGQRENL